MRQEKLDLLSNLVLVTEVMPVFRQLLLVGVDLPGACGQGYGSAFTTPEVIVPRIVGDAAQPVFKGSGRFPQVKFTVGLDKGLLHQVFQIGLVGTKAKETAGNHSLMTDYYLIEGMEVSLPCPIDQFSIRVGFRLHLQVKNC